MGLFGLRLELWRLRGAIEALKNAIESHGRAGSTQDETKRNPPPTTQSVNACVSFDDQAVGDTKAENDRQYDVQNSIRWAAWCAFGAASIYAGIASYQVRLTRQQIRQSTEQFRTDERAWVEIDPIKPFLLAARDKQFGATYTCNIYPKNVGKTSATNIEARATDVLSANGWDNVSSVVSKSQDMLFNKDMPNVFHSHVPSVLAPNSISPVPFSLTCAAPKNGGVHYLIGRMNYCDEFNVRHWLRFCFYVATDRGEIWACENGNYEDKNPETQTSDTACGKPN